MTSDTDVAMADLPRLRVLTCGSVDDGKSTLIGRLLYDCEQIPEDILQATRAFSASGAVGPEGLDFAFLLDGLEAEREQGITIDVSYRSFVIANRVCQIADCPGHAQYTRNMVTAASNCEAAIVLIDARHGVVEQTRRHLRICAMMGIKDIAIAINKMDLCAWSRQVFEKTIEIATPLVASLNFDSVTFIPISALTGSNVASVADQAPWYDGKTLLDWLGHVRPMVAVSTALRFPVQYVSRFDQDKRTYLGTLCSGSLEVGQTVIVGPERVEAKVSAIFDAGTSVNQARSGTALGITLDRPIDLARGDILCDDQGSAVYASQMVADIIWFSQTPMVPGRSYAFKGAGAWRQGNISRLKYRVDLISGAEIVANVLGANDIGCANITTTQPILCDPYSDNRLTGGLLVVDTQTNETLGIGLIHHDLRRSTSIFPVDAAVDGPTRALRNQHKPLVLWLTGLSGSGKSTIAGLTEQNLWARHFATTILDGDNLRGGLNQDLGFTEFDRVENVRRTAEVAKLMADAGLVVVCALISPFARDREMARTIIGADRFIEVFISTSVDVCASRDPKGLYAKAFSGLIPNFTGVSAPYEVPIKPEIVIDTANLSAVQASEAISKYVVAATGLDGA